MAEATKTNVVTKEVTTEVTEENKKKELHLEMEPISIPSIGRLMRVNSAWLARQIRQKLQEIFHDCAGVYIEYTPNEHGVPVLKTTIYFEWNAQPLPEGKMKNLVNLTTGDGVNRNDFMSRTMTIQNKMKGKTYTLNNETKELLSDFMYGGRRANKPDNKGAWARHIQERAISANNMYYARGAERILIGVTDFDIHLLIRALFGDTMVINTVYEDGKVTNKTATARYAARFSKMLPDGTFMINIDQYDDNAVSEAVQKENPLMHQQFGIPMY